MVPLFLRSFLASQRRTRHEKYFLECERKQSVQFWRRRFLFESPFAFEQKATLVVAPYKDKVTPRFNETAYIIDWTDWSDDDEF